MARANCIPLLVALVLLLVLIPINTAASEPPSPPDAPVPRWEKVDPNLRDRLSDLSEEVPVEFVLRLADRADLAAAQFQRGEVVRRLRTVAADSQTDLLPLLHEAGFQVTASFWITNALLVQGPAGQVPVLTTSPRVDRLHSNFQVEALGSESPSSEDVSKTSLTWGLERVGAERVWSELGVRGAGVRVCVSDTGVDVSHPDLAGKMWSDVPGDPLYPGGWIEFGSSGNPVPGSTPHDTNGHGTHTSGTVLGGDASGAAIGMAPEATLMHALVMPGGGGTFAQAIAGIEWCVSPYDGDGAPAGQPADVHSMSWGASGYANELVDPIRNSYLAGTLPVASAGNCGEGCTNSPGNIYDALGIGASDVSDHIADISSGEVVQKLNWNSPPADWPTDWITPTVSAPGVKVLSSLPNGTYAEWSGTSMATTHVAGCVALMLSADPTLTPAAIREGLVATAVWFDTYNPMPPDLRYGWGRIDCFAAAGGTGAGAVIVDFDLEVDPPVGLWSDTFRVQIKAVNGGNASGSYTAELLVDDVPEGQQTVLLSPGETKVVTFSVSRDAVATYRVAIGSHSSSFRVRPPVVTVEARDVNGSAMPGAEVTVGLGASVLPMGVTDGTGTLAFDSPAGSHGQYWIVLQAKDVGGLGIHYFLSQNLSIESDTLASFLPTPDSTATLAVAMEEVVAGQMGSVTLMRSEMPPGSSDVYTYPPGAILVDPANYSAWAQMTVQTVQNTWTYRSASLLWDLNAAPSAAFPFGGPLTVALNWMQSQRDATVDWSITDAYGNALVEVTQERVGILAGESIAHVPSVSLWNPQGTRLGGLYVAWDQKPVNLTLPDNETLAFVQVDLETGPYPFSNTFVLMTEVSDGGGTPLPAVAATRSLSVDVRGTVLLDGRPLPIILTVGGLPVAVEANGTVS
ncbi:MAG: S8 family serine peptidase, partial [candidate division NC10 bacterium]